MIDRKQYKLPFREKGRTQWPCPTCSKGVLAIHAGYAWDGASGPVIDRPSVMRASLIHDALYQLIREGHLSIKFRDQCDRLFKRLCIEDGTNKFLAHIYYLGLKYAGGPAASPSSIRQTLVAPEQN